MSSTQVCAGHKSGSEAAIHAMRNIFDADETDVVFLVDSNSSNSFNAPNKCGAESQSAVSNHSNLCE